MTWRLIPSLFDPVENTVVVTAFEEIEPGTFRRIFKVVPALGWILPDGTYRFACDCAMGGHATM